MKDIERPSILAVGMPEMFGLSSGAGSDAFDPQFDAASGANANDRRTRSIPEAGLLQWMIYSSAKSLHRSAFSLSDRISSKVAGGDVKASTPDDSAFGIELQGEPGGVRGGSQQEVSQWNGERSLNESSDQASENSEVSFIHAATAKRAIELLRTLRFDLLLTSDQLPDMAMSQFIGRIRSVRPWQKWALVASSNSPQAEITARSLGTAAIFDAPADLELISELAHAVTTRTPARMAVGASSADLEPHAAVAATRTRRQTLPRSGMPVSKRVKTIQGGPLRQNNV